MHPSPAAPPAPAAVVGILRALADENRLSILEALRGGERCVCELQVDLELSQSLLSHHLRILRESNLVRSRREGRWVHYSVASESIQQMDDYLRHLLTDVTSP